MQQPHFNQLSTSQRAGWYFTAFVAALGMLAVGYLYDAFSNADTVWFAAAVFAVAWVVVIALLRLYVQQIEDPTSLRSILLAGRKKS